MTLHLPEAKSRRQLIDEAQGLFEQAGTQMAADKARVLRIQTDLAHAADKSKSSVQAFADAETRLARVLAGDPEPHPLAIDDEAARTVVREPNGSAVDRETVDAAIEF